MSISAAMTRDQVLAVLRRHGRDPAGVPFAELRERRCRFFVAGTPGPRARCCGAPVAGKEGIAGSYCRAHLARMVVPVPGRGDLERLAKVLT